ncbi:hypothetical protein GCM10027565_42410 [Bordetella tumulicola]
MHNRQAMQQAYCGTAGLVLVGTRRGDKRAFRVEGDDSVDLRIAGPDAIQVRASQFDGADVAGLDQGTHVGGAKVT